MSFFSRLFNGEDEALNEPQRSESDRDFEARLARFMKSRKNSESLKKALDEWDKVHRNVDDPDFITEEEKKKIMDELFPRRLAFDSFSLRDVSESESAFPPPVSSGSSNAVAMDNCGGASNGPGVTNIPIGAPGAGSPPPSPKTLSLPGAVPKGMIPCGSSPYGHGRPKADKLEPSPFDMLPDPLARFPINPRILKHFQARRWVTFSANAILATHEVINLCCTIPGKDAIAHGYKVVCSSHEHGKTEEARESHASMEARFLHDIKVAADKMGMNDICAELNYKKKVYGVGIAIPRVKFRKDAKSPSDPSGNTPYSYADEYNPKMIEPGSYKGFAVVDPIWLTYDWDEESMSDPISPFFQVPTWINTHNRRIHRSWIIRVLNSEVPDVLKPAYYYAGLSLTQMIYERVWCADKIANEAPLLAMTKRLLITDGNIEQMIGDPRHTNIFFKAINYFRDNFSVFVKKPSHNVTQLDTNLGELSALTSQQYQLVAAISQIPVTKLFKNVPTGLQSTGEYEWDDYAQTLNTIQNNDYTPLLRKHFEIYCASFYPERDDIRLDIEWNPIDVPKEKEQVQMAAQYSQFVANLYSQGVITVAESRATLINTGLRTFQSVAASVPEILTKIEEQKDPEKAMLLQQKMAMINQMAAAGMMPGGGMPPGMPGKGGMMPGGAPTGAVPGGDVPPQGQAAEAPQPDPVTAQNDNMIKEALKRTVGEERYNEIMGTKPQPQAEAPAPQQEAQAAQPQPAQAPAPQGGPTWKEKIKS